MIFFGIIEIYAREFKTETGWKLDITLHYLRKKFNRTRNKPITNTLETIKNSGKWEIVINNDDVSIFIPKFTELMDESTIKKLREKEKSFRNVSGIFPKSAPTDLDADADLDKDKNKKALMTIPSKEEITESSEPKIEEEINRLTKCLYDEKIFMEVHAFKNKMLKGKNVRAILHTLARCYLTKPDDPWAYCKKIIDVESLNYNESDYEKTTR